jgi:hypothetical protein
MKKTTTGLMALTALLCAPLALADNHAKPPNIASVWKLSPKSDVGTAAFEQAMKTHLDWRMSQGDPRSWQVFTVTTGGDRGDYYVRACCFNWADQDSYEKWSYDNKVSTGYQEQLGIHVEDITHTFQAIDIENSHWEEGESPFYYVGVTQFLPNPAKQMQTGQAREKMSQLAIDKGWDSNWAWYTVIGGEDNLMLAAGYRNYADMAPPEKSFSEFAAEHMGQDDAMEMMEDFGEGFWSSTYTIYRWREDLSMPRPD